MKRLAPLARPFLWQYAAAIALLIATSLLALLPPILLKVLIDNAIRSGNVTLLHSMAGLLIGIAIFTGLIRGLMEYVHEWVSAHFILSLRSTLLRNVLAQSLSFFSRSKTGDVIARLRSDTTAVYGVLVNTFLGTLSELVQIIGTAAVLIYMDWKLGTIAISFVLPLYFVVVYSGKRIKQFSLTVRDKDAGLLDFFQERITNIQTVKLFHREAFEENRHRQLSRDVISIGLARVRYKFLWMFLVLTLTTIAGILVVWYGGLQVIDGSLSFGALIAFYLYTSRLYTPVQSIANRGVELYNGLASAQRIFEYLDLKPALAEAAPPAVLTNPRGQVDFRQVSFSYPGRNGRAVDSFSLSIRPGEKIALVGRSGAGKTTLIHLLCRLYDVDSGAIGIDGHDIRSLSFDSLYDAIAVVPQETCLFNGTVEENIRYGDPSASAERVIEAAKRAHVHDFIQGLPLGYATCIGRSTRNGPFRRSATADRPGSDPTEAGKDLDTRRVHICTRFRI
jgi:ATP-binding cassette subfamily B protein